MGAPRREELVGVPLGAVFGRVGENAEQGVGTTEAFPGPREGSEPAERHARLGRPRRPCAAR